MVLVKLLLLYGITLSAFPAWNGASTSPEDMRGEKQNASVQDRTAAATTKQVDFIILLLFELNLCTRSSSSVRC